MLLFGLYCCCAAFAAGRYPAGPHARHVVAVACVYSRLCCRCYLAYGLYGLRAVACVCSKIGVCAPLGMFHCFRLSLPLGEESVWTWTRAECGAHAHMLTTECKVLIAGVDWWRAGGWLGLASSDLRLGAAVAHLHPTHLPTTPARAGHLDRDSHCIMQLTPRRAV